MADDCFAAAITLSKNFGVVGVGYGWCRWVRVRVWVVVMVFDMDGGDDFLGCVFVFLCLDFIIIINTEFPVKTSVYVWFLGILIFLNGVMEMFYCFNFF